MTKFGFCVFPKRKSKSKSKNESSESPSTSSCKRKRKVLRNFEKIETEIKVLGEPSPKISNWYCLRTRPVSAKTKVEFIREIDRD